MDRAEGSERRIALLTPGPGWDPRRFEEYWLHRHGPIVAGTEGYGRYREDYVQDHVLRSDLGVEPFPFAGVASVRLPAGDVPDFSSTELFRDRILPDEERFLDRRACIAVRVRESRVLPGEGPVKCMAFGRFASTQQELPSTRTAYDMLPAAAPRPSGSLIGEVLAPPTDLSGAVLPQAPRFDWVEETRFAREEDAIDHFSARRHHDAAAPLWAFLSREYVLFAVGQATRG